MNSKQEELKRKKEQYKNVKRLIFNAHQMRKPHDNLYYEEIKLEKEIRELEKETLQDRLD